MPHGGQAGDQGDGAGAAGVESLPFLVAVEDGAEAGGENTMGGLFARRREDGEPRVRVRDIPVAVLRENLQRAVNGLQQVLGSIEVPEGAMPLTQAQVSFEVTAGGGIAFVGTSAQVAAKGAITLTFGA